MPELDDGILVAFVDGELDPAAMRDVAGLLACDPSAQEKVRLLRSSATLVRAAFDDPNYGQVPPALAAMVARPDARSTPARPPWHRRLTMAAIAVAAALVGFASGVTTGRIRAPVEVPPTQELLDEVADYHVVYAREAGQLGQIPASSGDQITTWFGKVLHRRVPIPDLSGVGLVFQGARLLVVDGRPVAQMLYAWPRQPDKPVGLCISFGQTSDAKLTTQHRAGVNLAAWGDAGYTYVLVGWVGTGMLTELAAQVRPNLDIL